MIFQHSDLYATPSFLSFFVSWFLLGISGSRPHDFLKSLRPGEACRMCRDLLNGLFITVCLP